VLERSKWWFGEVSNNFELDRDRYGGDFMHDACNTPEFITNSKCPLCNPSQSQNHCCDLHNVVDITVIDINSK
jgi:hypothetical protein